MTNTGIIQNHCITFQELAQYSHLLLLLVLLLVRLSPQLLGVRFILSIVHLQQVVLPSELGEAVSANPGVLGLVPEPAKCRAPLYILREFLFRRTITQLTRAPLGGGGYFEPSPSRFLTISSKPMQVSPLNWQYPLSQQFYTLC